MKQPLLFIGHGSPMNAIEDNIYTESWKNIGKSLPRPRAILMFSAHWITFGETRIASNDHPEMIYDMGGFPPELYRVKYDAPGSRKITQEIGSIFRKNSQLQIQEDQYRGFDHGIWSTLIHLFPHADIPVISMSLDYHASPRSLYEIGIGLQHLRETGVLIIGSGNIVHNLAMIDWLGEHTYPWAIEFDRRISEGIMGGHNSLGYTDILDFQSWGEVSRLAHPSYDHLLPLFPLLGATTSDDRVTFSTPDIVMGSLSMRSILWR